MAVPKRRTSAAKRDKRRAHDALQAPHVIACPQCGEATHRHRACPHCGTYRGRKVVDVGDAVRGVRERGRLMQEAVPPGEGAMAAVLGLEAEAVASLCAAAAGTDVLAPANLNGGGQIVVAGHARAVERLAELATARRGRVQRLPVSAPFHCALMAPAAAGLERFLAGVSFRTPAVPVVTSVAARPVASAAELPSLLVRQVTAPVRWEETVRELARFGARLALEIGPGHVLTGLTKRIEPALAGVPVGDLDGIARARELLA